MATCPVCGHESPEGFKFCGTCGAQLGEPRTPAEERKVVSVLFVDLVGFTNRADHADPEDVRATLRPYHERLRQEIERFGGTVEKFIGDAVMAVFGAPVAREDDAERAVRAALRILEAIDDLNDARPGLDLAVRGAVGTGEAVVSLSARPERGEGIATGDVVNTASRLQNVAPVGGIVVDETTFRSTRTAIEYEQLEPVELKGKAEAVPLWRVLRARSRFGVDVEHGTRTPFVGREHELTLLKETFARAVRESAIQLVTVTGEPGVGKTRLVSEFRGWVDDQPELVYWRQGRCLPYGEGITFWALGEIVKAHAGILESDPQEDAAAKIAATVEAVIEAGDRDWVARELATLVGVSAAGGEREEAFAAWRRFLESIAATRPLVLVVEDLHWADSALISFLEELLDWATTVPLLVLCTARPELHERHGGWGAGKRNLSTLSLAPLSADETTHLLAALLEQAVLPADTQAVLLERAGGNPLYAEEFVRMLFDRGVLVRRGRALALAANGEIAVPETVHALISARLDTLPAERKALLHDAAVVGKVFWSGALADVGGREIRAVEEGMRELGRKELVRPARVSSMAGQAEFSFWHLAIRDVAYGQTPREARAEKHRAVARWLEKAAGDRVDDVSELLAHHYQEALSLAQAAGRDELAEELRRPAVTFLLQAGERAARLDALGGEEYFARAAELARDDEPEAPWAGLHLMQARVNSGKSNFAEAIPAVDDLVSTFRSTGDAKGEGAALSTLALLHWRSGEAEVAGKVIRDAVGVLERLPPSEELVYAYGRQAFWEQTDGRPEGALEAAERAIALGSEFDSVPRGLVTALWARGGARYLLGDSHGIEDLREALRLAQEGGLALSAALSYINLADYVWVDEGPAAALRLQRVGIEFSRARGLQHAWAEAETAWTLFELGAWDELTATVDRLLERADGGALEGQPAIMAETFKALVLAWRGRLDAAAALATRFLPAARETRLPQVYQPALGTAIVIEHARGDEAAARDLVGELADFQQERPHTFVGVGIPDAVRAALRLGELALAEQLVSRTHTTSWRERNVIAGGRAALAEARGEAGAGDLYREAAQQWREYGFALEEAFALLGLARCADDAAARRDGEAILTRLGVQAAADESPAAARAK